MFEWDTRKAAVNRAKHGVSFEEAGTVFGDPDALDGPDLRHSEEESRFLQTMARASASSARAERAAKNGSPMRRRIDFSDIPEASPAQIRAMRRVGRPPFGAAARRLIAIRIDPQVLDAVRREAKRRGLGYQSLINNLLAKHVARVRSA